jgi:hypothetical protein
MYLNVARGADPELFLQTQKDAQPVVSIGLIGGTKQSPRQLGHGYALQEDNVAVEFNVPIAKTADEFAASIQYVLGYLRQELEPKGLELVITPTMEFTKDQLDHPQAQELGCEPDYNAWTLAENPRPKAPETLRSAGGHLHLSWDNPTKVECVRVVKVHDLFCGTAALLHDADNKRREIYGKAGACRFKEYGVEYRTLSNFWIKDEELTKFIFNQSEKAMQFLRNGGRIDAEDSQKIQDCINNSDLNLFHELNDKYGIV